MYMIGNQIRFDATLRFDHEDLLLGRQGQMIFSAMFMFHGFKPTTSFIIMKLYEMYEHAL